MKSQATGKGVVIGAVVCLTTLGWWLYREKENFNGSNSDVRYQDTLSPNKEAEGKIKSIQQKNTTSSVSLGNSNDDTSNQMLRSQSIMSFQQSYSQKLYDGRSVKQNQQSILNGGGSSYRLMEFSRGIGALLTIYKATESIDYLEEALSQSERIITKTKIGKEIPNNPENFRDNYRGWVNINPNKRENGGPHLREVPLFESYLFRYMAKLAYLIEKDKNLSPLIKNRGKAIYKFVETNGWEKWFERGERNSSGCYQYLFRSRTHMTSHWAIVALYLNQITESQEKREQYNNFLTLFDKQLKSNFRLTTGNAYIWNQTWDQPWPSGTDCNPRQTNAIIQDVSHGNHVVTYIVEAYELQSESWNETDIERLINTVRYVIYDQNKNRFNGNLGGKFITQLADGVKMSDGFLKLCRYDENLLELFEDVKKENSGEYKFALEEAQYVAEIALSRKYAIQ